MLTSGWSIMVHGGAGNAPDADPAPYLAGVRAAALAGRAILAAGGTALDAVEAAVRALEDDPLFNAGTGASLTETGDVEFDASIMEGTSLRSGAVAVVKDVRNPISLARLVMERTPHAMLAGPATSTFAREVGVGAIPNAALVTARQRQKWESGRAAATSKAGTVGAVARDARSRLAAATSTGGMMHKRPGRVGDTPIIGAGTYADDQLAAVSCTGHGERIIAVTLARLAADLAARGMPAMEAARAAIERLDAKAPGEAGLILVTPAGELGHAYNTPRMSRASATERDDVVADI